MYKDLLENGIKAGLHWGSARNKVNPETYGYLLGYRQQKDQKKVSLGLNADAGTYSVIDLDLSFQALRRAIQYIQKARQADGQIVCIIDNSLPATLSQQLAYFALNNNLVVKTGKEAQAMLKVHARKRLAVLSQRGRRAHNRAQQLKAGGTYLKPSVANTFSSSQSALVAATETTRKQVAGLFMIGGLNSGRAMTIIAARKACVPVVSLCDPSACLDGITYPVIVNTTSSAAVYYILEVITYALLNTAPSTTLHNKV